MDVQRKYTLDRRHFATDPGRTHLSRQRDALAKWVSRVAGLARLGTCRAAYSCMHVQPSRSKLSKVHDIFRASYNIFVESDPCYY